VDIAVQSENTEDQSGAVLVTFQSQIYGFRGRASSSEESLVRSASLRLLSQMMREPLFDTLRTKQQLGYVVTSYYDVEFTAPPDGPDATAVVVPVESLVVKVVSKVLPPPEVAARVDAFLLSFARTLEEMPGEEIAEGVAALVEKLTRPPQNLGAEAAVHWGKIKKYAPECCRAGEGGAEQLPWEVAAELADAIGGLKRDDLVRTFQEVVVGEGRSRVVSCVYGSQFPMVGDSDGAE